MKKPANCAELAGFIEFCGVRGFEFPNEDIAKTPICSPICSPVSFCSPCLDLNLNYWESVTGQALGRAGDVWGVRVLDQNSRESNLSET